MKDSDLQKLRNKSIDELLKKLKDKRKKLSDLQFDLSLGKTKNVSQIRETKKDIARILTLINEKK
ncbi:MAG: 50S ribosomal protein L29 [Candidatus Magasanikbacteria bacterium]